MEIQNFITKYPNLYHMAEPDTWPLIRDLGLLSTTAVLDLHNLTAQDRQEYETFHRPTMMTVSSKGQPAITLRDQIPMPPQRIHKALRNGITAEEWYEFLNKKVFFWATRERLIRLLNARYYRNISHDVLTIDTASFVHANLERIRICHMNSGNTFPMPHQRDYSIFTSIDTYPTKANGNALKEVAEVTVEYSVPDISNYVIRVDKMLGPVVQSTVFES